MVRRNYITSDDDDVHFVLDGLDQHAELDFYSYLTETAVHG